jgi:hypothetical protein
MNFSDSAIIDWMTGEVSNQKRNEIYVDYNLVEMTNC